MKPQPEEGKASVDVLTGNKIIAYFMGCYGDTHYVGDKPVLRYGFRETHITERWNENKFCDNTPYHSDWDWLMPVVEKIKSLGFFYKLTEWQFFICKYSDYSGVISYDSKTDIDEPEIDRVFKTVVRFVTWNNTQTKKQ